MKNKTIQALLEGREENHQLPFLWLHGEDEATLRQMMAVIHGANCGAVCLESRTHPDFCGPQWWHDVDIILEEAKARGMQVWILDDKHYPSGMANGALLQAPEELCRQNIFCNRLALGEEAGPVALSLRQAGLLEGPGPTQEDIRQGFLPGEPARRFDPAGDRVLTLQAVKDGAVLDLSPFLQGEELRWDKPAGAWELQVVAASRNTGFHRDYINMLDKASVRLLLEAVYEPHWQRYSQEFGKTLAGFFSDEPNLGNGPTYTKGNTLGCGQDLPWSRELESALEESWGPGWRQELPRLFSQDGSEETARFHTAYMDLVTKLVREDFSQQVADWCHQRGVAYIGHVIEDDGQHCRTGSSLGHFFRGLQGQDMAGIDDIGGQVLPQGEDGPTLNPKGRPRNGEFYHYGLGALAASSAALEPGKAGNAMCEIFGNYGWQEGVRLEKYLADHFLVRGINYFVPHAFTGHPFPDPDCPPHFYAQGHNPQYRHFGKLLQAMNRVATVTSSGPHRVEAAVLYHGESQWCDPQAMAFEHALRPLYDQQNPLPCGACRRIRRAGALPHPAGQSLGYQRAAVPGFCGAGGQEASRRGGRWAGSFSPGGAAGVLRWGDAPGPVRGRASPLRPGSLPRFGARRFARRFAESWGGSAGGVPGLRQAAAAGGGGRIPLRGALQRGNGALRGHGVLPRAGGALLLVRPLAQPLPEGPL